MGTKCKCEPLTTDALVNALYAAYLQSVYAVQSGYNKDVGAHIIKTDFVIMPKDKIFNIHQRECIEASIAKYELKKCTECDNKSPLSEGRHYRTFLVTNHNKYELWLNILNEHSRVGIDAWIKGQTPPLLKVGFRSSLKKSIDAEEPQDSQSSIKEPIEDTSVDWDEEFDFEFGDE